MRKFESSQKDESRAKLAASSEAYRKPFRAFDYAIKVAQLAEILSVSRKYLMQLKYCQA